MSNLHNRLKKAEATQLLDDKKHIVFVRQAPNVKSEAEKQFFKDHQSDLSNYKILIITWHDPKADENIRRIQKQNRN